MNLPYYTRRRLQRFGLVALIALLVAILIWFCWVIWLERFVVYSREGAQFDFEPADPGVGQVAAPPSKNDPISLYVNEGSDAIDTNTELTQINGFYIDTDTLQNDLAGARDTVAHLTSGTAVMVELKNIWGTFFYTSKLQDATLSTALSTAEVDSLITDINSRNLYSVAVIPAFRERYYCLIDSSHSGAGLPQKGKRYLWADDKSCYWLNPESKAALNWIISIVEELKALGFDEVVFTEFRFPNTQSVTFGGSRSEAVANAAKKIVEQCATGGFAVSFMTEDTSFPLPEGRTRLYMQNISAKNAGAIAASMELENAAARLVFMANTNDTRFDEYSVIRPIATAGTN